MNKNLFIHSRVIPEERRLLEQLCEIERRNMSDMIRELIRAEGRKRCLWPVDIHAGQGENGGGS